MPPWRATIVYSCVADGDDPLCFANKHFESAANVKYCLFSKNLVEVPGWEVLPMEDQANPQKVSRWYKSQPHILFPEFDSYIWVENPKMLERRFSDIISSGPLGAYEHQARDCVYAEYKACLALRKDTNENMLPQIMKYEKEKYPKHYGLADTSCLFRERTPEINKFNAMWWGQIFRYSRCDQLSFDYVARSLGIKYNKISKTT
jgi:hypothetical protein